MTASLTSSGRDLLTVEQAADYLGVHPHTVRRFVNGGRLAATRPGGWAIRIHRKELARFAGVPHEASR